MVVICPLSNRGWSSVLPQPLLFFSQNSLHVNLEAKKVLACPCGQLFLLYRGGRCLCVFLINLAAKCLITVRSIVLHRQRRSGGGFAQMRRVLNSSRPSCLVDTRNQI